jgi:hypothetical protein
MQKHLLLLFVLCFWGISLSYGQQWMVYDASVLPNQTSGEALDLTSLSQDAPGPNFEEQLINDPDIPGNSLLRYVQPDTNSTKMYRFIFQDTTGAAWTGQNLTLVARIKGLDDWQTLGLDRIFDLQYRVGTAGFRDELRLEYATDVIDLDRANVSVNSGVDLTEWHVFRVAIFGDSSVVYLDEDPTPVLTGVSTAATSDLYLKIGDGSGDKVGGLVDWVGLDTTGAYSPSESPLNLPVFTGVGNDPVTPAWMIYHADVLPNQTGGDPLDLTSLSQDAPGPNFEEMLVGDPDIPGNSLLRYVQPDTNSTKMYRFIFQDTTGAAWTGSELTLVARLKGLEDWQALGLERVFDLQYRNGNVNARDELRVIYDNDAVGLDRSSVETSPGIDVTEWHIYRVAVFGDSSVVYVDENPVPVLTGVSTSTTSDTYLKIGDGSGSTVGGWVDWVALDTTGAYSPLQTALDPALFDGVGPIDIKANILFVTDQSFKGIDGTYGDSMYVATLRNAGYNVILPDYSVMASVDSAGLALLDSVDLAIIGRGVSSGDFDDADDSIWEEIQIPLVLMSNYVARNNRLRWFNSSSALYATRFGTLQAAVEQLEDTAFTDVDITSGVIDYADDFISFIEVPDPSSINGELLLTITDGPEGYIVDTDNGNVTDTVQLSDYNGNVLMARFAPGDSMYFGGGAAVPAGWRSYFTAGDDHDYDQVLQRRLFEFSVFSDDMYQVFLTEIDYLLRGPTKDTSNTGVGILTPAHGHGVSVTAYPNPFQEELTLTLRLSMSGDITVQLFTLEGRMMATKPLGELAAGEHQVAVDGRQLSAGVYFYRVLIGNQAIVGKIRKN